MLTLTRPPGVTVTRYLPQVPSWQKQVGGMGGKRKTQPSGNAQGKAAASGDAVAGGASQKRQARGLSVHGADAGSAGAGSSGQEESGSILAHVTMGLSMRCDATALAGRKAALEAALRELMAEFGGRECRVAWTQVGPSKDTLQRVLPLVLERVEPDGAAKCWFVCKSWRRELEARGCCSKTVQMCSALAGSADAERFQQNAQRRLDASTGDDAERALCMDGGAFLSKMLGRAPEKRPEGNLHEWLQAASQEPDASFSSRGAASTAQSLGLQLVQWVGKPQGRYPELYTVSGHSSASVSVSFSLDGKRIVSGSLDQLVKIWKTETGAEVSLLECPLREVR